MRDPVAATLSRTIDMAAAIRRIDRRLRGRTTRL
jgi:hypothetical protein